MFTDATARGSIAAIQGEIAEFRALVTASNRQLAALADRLTTLAGDVALLAERDGGHDAALDRLSSRLDEIGTAIDRHAALLDGHDRRLSDGDRTARERQGEVTRLGTEIERLERQAAIDAREMRDNYAGLAAIIVQQRRTAASPDGQPDALPYP